MPLPPTEIGSRIRTIREDLGKTRDELAEVLGVSPAVVASLEAGTLDPVPGDYVLLAARFLATDFRYFISRDLDSVEAEARRLLRALAGPSAEDRLAMKRFVGFCQNEVELGRLLDDPSPELPPAYPLPSGQRHKDHGAEAARAERLRLGMGDRPIRDIFRLLRQQGVHLFRHRLKDRNLSGVTILHPTASICVLVNYQEDLYRQFFSAAHEYGHVLFDRSIVQSKGYVMSYYTARELEEMRANVFAGEFLLPTEALERFPKPTDRAAINRLTLEIGRTYRVNTETVAIRLREVGRISKADVETFRPQRPKIPTNDKRDPEVPESLSAAQAARRLSALEVGVSGHYLELLRRALTSDKITFGRFAEMLNMTRDEARQFALASALAL